MDFNVFYCNPVNILIHFFFPITGLLDESYLVGDWEGRGTGIHHLSSKQYSSVTVSTWWPTQLENLPLETLGPRTKPQGPRHASGTVAEQRTDFVMGQPLKKGS